MIFCIFYTIYYTIIFHKYDINIHSLDTTIIFESKVITKIHYIMSRIIKTWEQLLNNGPSIIFLEQFRICMRIRRIVFIWPKSTHCGTAIVSLVSGYAWDDGSSDSRLFILHSFSFNAALPRLSLSLPLNQIHPHNFHSEPDRRNCGLATLLLEENQTLVFSQCTEIWRWLGPIFDCLEDDSFCFRSMTIVSPIVEIEVSNGNFFQSEGKRGVEISFSLVSLTKILLVNVA